VFFSLSSPEGLCLLLLLDEDKREKIPDAKFEGCRGYIEEVEDISLKDRHQYQQRRRDDKLRSSGERIHVAVRSHETIHERRRRRRVGIVAVLL